MSIHKLLKKEGDNESHVITTMAKTSPRVQAAEIYQLLGVNAPKVQILYTFKDVYGNVGENEDRMTLLHSAYQHEDQKVAS